MKKETCSGDVRVRCIRTATGNIRPLYDAASRSGWEGACQDNCLYSLKERLSFFYKERRFWLRETTCTRSLYFSVPIPSLVRIFAVILIISMYSKLRQHVDALGEWLNLPSSKPQRAWPYRRQVCVSDPGGLQSQGPAVIGKCSNDGDRDDRGYVA